MLCPEKVCLPDSALESLVAALERQIETRADAMPVTEQIRRVAELEATVLD